MTTKPNVSALSDTTEWIGRKEIESIAGALKPSAYVARAYKHTQQNGGAFPAWARKQDNDKWLFLAEYIRADAKKNTETISVHEAAEILGATRRAVQIWVDQGEIPALEGNNREEGEERRIIRETFMKELPRLKMRLETPSVVIRKIKGGYDIPTDVVKRVHSEMRATEMAARERDRIRRQDKRECKQAVNSTGIPATDGEAAVPPVEESRDAGYSREGPRPRGPSFGDSSPESIVETPIETPSEILPANVVTNQLKVTDKESIALTLEQRLKAAAETRKRTEAAAGVRTSPGAAAKTEAVHRQTLKERSVAALEARLNAAAVQKASTTAANRAKLEERARFLAETIQTRMYDESFGTRKAMIMFIQEAADQGIPRDIRIKISGEVFGE
jgi:excisionase family DNA binding protein